MASSEPLSLDVLASLFEKEAAKPGRDELEQALAALEGDYAGRGVELKKVASGFRFQVRSNLSAWINRLFEEKPQRYSQALLETLAIIAYRQPVTRGEIEDLRGVSVSSSIIRTLLDREWIKTVGHREAPGRPELLATTKQFLDYFNLDTLAKLPTPLQLDELPTAAPGLFAAAGQSAADADDGAAGRADPGPVAANAPSAVNEQAAVDGDDGGAAGRADPGPVAADKQSAADADAADQAEPGSAAADGQSAAGAAVDAPSAANAPSAVDGDDGGAAGRADPGPVAADKQSAADADGTADRAEPEPAAGDGQPTVDAAAAGTADQTEPEPAVADKQSAVDADGMASQPESGLLAAEGASSSSES